MKRIFRVALTLVLLSVSAAFADTDSAQNSSPFYNGGDVLIGVRAGGGSLGYMVAPSFEVIGGHFIKSDLVPAVWGLAAFGFVGRYWGGMALGASAALTLRFGIRNTPIPPLNRLEVQIGFGPKWDTSGSYSMYPGFGFMSFGGFKYKISDSMGIVAEDFYWGNGHAGSVGIEMSF